MTLFALLKRLALLTLVGFLIYLTWYLNTQTFADKEIKPEEPQLEMYGYTLKQYNADGELASILTGPYLKHFDGEMGTFLQDPNLIQYELQPDQTRIISWTAKSDNAHLNEDSSLITLKDNVVLYRPPLENRDEETVTTEKLLIHDKGERISTDLFIRLESPSYFTEGIGLTGFPSRGEYRLHNATKSQYETKKP